MQQHSWYKKHQRDACQSIWAALAAMSAAVDEYLDKLGDAGDDAEEARLKLWPDHALQMLIFASMHDPSVRMRRACMALMTSVAVRT